MSYLSTIENSQNKSGKKICPSRMSDGRFFTDYRPRCIINSDLNESIVKNNMINSSYESRMYLQNNADTVIAEQKIKAYETMVPCIPCNRPHSDNGTMLPERYVVKCDTVSCQRKEVDKNGLGDGRNFM